MNTLLRDIKNTLAYFDQFSYPLTAVELWNFLWQSQGAPHNTWFEFISVLENNVAAQTIASQAGFYFLPGQESHVISRQRARLLVERKLAVARSAAPLLGLVPGVEAILVCNTVAAGWPSLESDIDLLVIVKPGRLWLTRLLFTIATILLTKRRHNHTVADHLCLSFFITRDQLNISTVRSSEPDIYLVYWVQQLVLLVGDGEIMREINQANSWVKQYTPHFDQLNFDQHPLVRLKYAARIFKKIGEVFYLSVFEKIARYFQKKRIDAKVHAPAPAVVISETMLKFHEHDRREYYQKVWQAKITEYKNV